VKEVLPVSNNELANTLNSIRNGDKTAFEELYKNLQTLIFTIIYRITWDKTVSEDVLQEVFLKLYLSPPEPSIKNPRAYICRIARNLAIDSTRKQSQHLSLDDITEPVHRPLDDFTFHMDMNAALESLPAQECEIVTLHVIAGLKFREISSIMEIPAGTAKWKYQKAISNLQKRLGGTV
jgi:RNA polymerase sigma-70 factor (ECF subfamily)